MQKRPYCNGSACKQYSSCLDGKCPLCCATENFLALEHHNIDNPWWEGLVKMTGSQPMITKGYANVPLDAPGLGIELNDDNIKAMMTKGAEYFASYT